MQKREIVKAKLPRDFLQQEPEVAGAGTIAGMSLITISMMSAFAYAGARSKWFTQRLAMASGLISLAFGLFLTYQIFFVKGLLTNHPQWTPH